MSRIFGGVHYRGAKFVQLFHHIGVSGADLSEMPIPYHR